MQKNKPALYENFIQRGWRMTANECTLEALDNEVVDKYQTEKVSAIFSWLLF